jgi:hypothetical protein
VDRLQYTWSWKSYRLGDTHNLTIVVDQAHAPAYTMPVDFRIITAAGVVDTSLWVSSTHEELRVTLPDSVLLVEFDPGHWILCDKTQVAPSGTGVPAVASLDQNFPNPFNPRTTVSFALPADAPVSLRIFDASGRLVRVLVSETLPAGTHERVWNGADASGRAVASGVYFCRLDAGSFSQTRKMILLR